MIRFCSPLIPDMDVVKKYIQPSFDVGHLSNFGQAYYKLCERLHSYLKLEEDKEIVIVSSGHTALQASYHVLGIKKPAITDYTFISTLVASFDEPIIVDCDAYGFLDMGHVGAESDGAVLVCPISRIPDLRFYEEECKKKNIPLVVDGAAAFGTPDIYNHGDCFCISFHATKTYSVGEGGAVICSKDIAKKIKQYINFGQDEHKNPIMHGTNAKISEFTCAIGLAVLDQIEQQDGPVSKRITNTEIYERELAEFVLPTFSAKTVYQTFPIYAKDKDMAERIRNKLRENNVEFLQYYKPLSFLKNSKMLYETNICLPCHQDMDECQAKQICDIILNAR